MRIQDRRGSFLIGVLLFSGLMLGGSLGRAEENLGGKLSFTLGQQRVLDAPTPLEQVAVGDPRVVDVKVISEGRQVLITAMGKGTTDLITWDAQGKQTTTLIQVILKDVRLIRDEISGMLGRMEGVDIRLVGERIVLDGEVFTMKDLERVKAVSKVYPNEVTVLVRMSPSVSRLIAGEITRSLEKNGYPDVRASGVGEKIFLEGTVARKEDLKAVGDLAAAYYDDFVNLVTLVGRQEELVMIDIHFVELGKSLGKKIGVNWDDSARFEVTDLSYTIGILRSASDTGSLELSGLQNFGATIDLQDTNGLARTLARPRLVCKSGEKAVFLAGGEVPYAVSGIGGGTVEFKEYGIRLRISPIAHRDGRISASVEAESSTLDYDNAVLGYPALKTRRVDTFVSLAKGQVLTLSGLVNQQDSKNVDKVPIIGSFPIIGELFKSRSFANDDTEMVIFLAAQLLTPESEMNLQEVQSIKDKYEKMDEKLKPGLFD